MIHRPPVTHGWEPLQGCELSAEASGCGLRTDARGKRGGVCTRWEAAAGGRRVPAQEDGGSVPGTDGSEEPTGFTDMGGRGEHGAGGRASRGWLQGVWPGSLEGWDATA